MFLIKSKSKCSKNIFLLLIGSANEIVLNSLFYYRIKFNKYRCIYLCLLPLLYVKHCKN